MRERLATGLSFIAVVMLSAACGDGNGTEVAVGDLSIADQAAIHAAVISDVFVRGTRGLPPMPGVLLLDHPMDDAGRQPVSISASASGEPFAPPLLEEISRLLVDLPLLGVVGSMEEALGADYDPGTAQTARPGLLVIVSPLEAGDDGFTIGAQVGPPGGSGWRYVVTVDGETATVVDAQEAWIS